MEENTKSENQEGLNKDQQASGNVDEKNKEIEIVLNLKKENEALKEKYEKLEKTIVILITNFKISNLEELEYHSTWKIMETKAKKKIILTNKLEIDIIELPKIRELIKKGKNTIKEKELEKWVKFLLTPEELEESEKENSDGIQ